MDFQFILSKQSEWCELYKQQRAAYKLQKNRAEKQRESELKEAKKNKDIQLIIN